ncbi:hypothetical protein ACXR0O_13495 [Verrucomicrobiota bacterium sgz303538]
MKTHVFIRALVSRRGGGRRWIACQLAAVALVVPFTAATPAHADNSGYTGYEGYEDYYRPPQRMVVPSRAYTYDAVNRRSSLTPEPVWRSMFPGIRERMSVEERTLGVPGDSEYEARYWRWWSRRARR